MARDRISLLIAFATLCQSLSIRAAEPIKVDTPSLLVFVDAANCRWSAEVKGTPMQLNDVHFPVLALRPMWRPFCCQSSARQTAPTLCRASGANVETLQPMVSIGLFDVIGRFTSSCVAWLQIGKCSLSESWLDERNQ